MNSKNIMDSVREGAEFNLYKKGVGSLRENCIFAESVNDIPEFLIKDGAIEVAENGKAITLNAVEGPATRKFPVYVCWEKVSKDNWEKVPGDYGSWPKDNGATTLKVVDGKCYNLPAIVKAALILEDKIPEWVEKAGFPVRRNGDTYELVRTDWGGDVRTGDIEDALWMCYGEGDVNILSLSEQSADSYVANIDGKEYSLKEIFE